MSKLRQPILTLAGFDPSGGAGALADIKTFEQHKLLGMAVNTANTVQNASTFQSINWIDQSLVFEQFNLLLQSYNFRYVKVGLIPSLEWIETVASKLPKAKLIWDPVLSASAGFEMGQDLKNLEQVLEKIYLITPNWAEIEKLSNHTDAIKGALELSKMTHVYLKGGHNPKDPGRDYLFFQGKQYQFRPKGKKVSEKHGSGCIFSSALAANLTLGFPVLKACLRAKDYVTRVLESNSTLLGYHKR